MSYFAPILAMSSVDGIEKIFPSQTLYFVGAFAILNAMVWRKLYACLAFGILVAFGIFFSKILSGLASQQKAPSATGASQMSPLDHREAKKLPLVWLAPEQPGDLFAPPSEQAGPTISDSSHQNADAIASNLALEGYMIVGGKVLTVIVRDEMTTESHRLSPGDSTPDGRFFLESCYLEGPSQPVAEIFDNLQRRLLILRLNR
jgi:hypothetical protein